MVAFDGGFDPGQASHTVLLELRRTVARHPAVQHASGAPPGQFTRVQAALNPARLGSDADEGQLTIRWYAGATPDATPEFAVHYSDASGVDCGWHHEPNPHVERWAHYQERTAADDDEYESISFDSLQPVPVLWAVLARLEQRVGDR
jgi:hypothetical protein